ncbi:MAG: crossover junction endodeoxyribonuclease RuvC [Thermoleophilia bacterium]
MNVVLGIDPGLANTGYALVVASSGKMRALDHGTIRTKPSTPHAERLRFIHDQIAALCSRGDITGVAVESWFVHPVSRAAMGMAETRGAVMVAAAGAGVPVTEYSPNTVKQSVTGSGSADKAQVRAMVARLCGDRPGTDHAADAMALAICHLTGAPLARAIHRAR